MEEASRGDTLLIDTCRRIVIAGRVTIHLARRPILFSLLTALGRAWPASAARDDLAAHAFETKKINASHRSRLRVEIGRLRKMMDGLDAEPIATETGYALRASRNVAMLLPPTDAEGDRVALLLGDGACRRGATKRRPTTDRSGSGDATNMPTPRSRHVTDGGHAQIENLRGPSLESHFKNSATGAPSADSEG
jgi:hypothetical protein